ncbi:MAG: tryptophan-rich sensory protein [Saprospiraceae bacterium]|nr:tryptophan-rich sensory protein [Candidatus Opimibacter skivensis]
MKEIKWPLLLICIAIPLVSGSLSGLAIADHISSWYSTLNKPSFNPPNYLFGPVWSVLYILMGIGLYLILQTPKSAMRTKSIVLFTVQLILNLSWSFIFFNAQSPLAALIIIGILWIAILMMMIYFHTLSPIASYLQIPYLLWVSFASVLNAAIWLLNK